jgi:hypothetical protein
MLFVADVDVPDNLAGSGTAICGSVAVIPRFAAALDLVPDLNADGTGSRAVAAAQ